MKSRQKSSKKFHCKKCIYTSRNKYDFEKHLSTTKHKMIKNGKKDNKNDNKKDNKNDNKNDNILKFECDVCNKIYKYSSGLSRHKKKCVFVNKSNLLKKNHESRQAAPTQQNMVLNSSSESVKILTEVLIKQGNLIEKLIKNQHEMIPKLGNNNNNKISVNLFLNSHCKNAMNLTDFVDNIKVSLEDLEYTNQHGYVKGISNIFARHLTDMKVTERPIHCSDTKRLQFYVKDSDKWEKDKSNVKIDKTIQKITKKQILKIKEWEQKHPNYLDNEQLTQEWHKMIFNMTGGEKDSDRAKNTINIKKKISENVIVKELIKND